MKNFLLNEKGIKKIKDDIEGLTKENTSSTKTKYIKISYVNMNQLLFEIIHYY